MRRRRRCRPGAGCPSSTPIRDAFDARLPFDLTAGQREVGAQIDADMERDHPMHRLLQGDVGSGKTVVALRAMLRVVDAGGQAALLAPTEVLAAQHHRSITAMLGPLAEAGRFGAADAATRVALVTGSQRVATRRRELLDVVTGDAGIVIGTHALLEDTVTFGDLGLVVVDEQHRFGVEQRAALAAKSLDGSRPHVLVMTATPIPRTVAMTVFGDVEVSVLSELPAGRLPIATHVVGTDQPRLLARAWARVREEAEQGHRVFVVCPRIGGDASVSELEAMWDADEERPTGDGGAPGSSVLDLARSLGEGELAGLRIGVLHGRMAAEEKEDAMRRFSDPNAVGGARRAGLDDGDRGRRRRAAGDDDGRHGRRPVRHLPAAPAARPRRPRRAALAVPARDVGGGGLARQGAARRGGVHDRRLRAVRARPAAAPRGRRARQLAVGRAQLAAAARGVEAR